MKTRTQVHNLFKQKNYAKFIDLIQDNEEVLDGEVNLLNQEVVSFGTDSEIDSYGLKKKRKSSFSSRTDNDLYEAEEILGKRKRKGKIYYQVKWKDFPREKSTWELKSNFTKGSLILLKEFEKKRREEKIKFLSTNYKNSQSTSESAKNTTRFSKRILTLNNKKTDGDVKEIDLCSNKSSAKSESSKNDDASYKTTTNFQFTNSSFSDISPYTITVSNISSPKRSNTNKKVKSLISKKTNDNYPESTLADIKTDKIKKIISAQIIDSKDLEMSCLLEFEQRPCGIIPDPRRYSSKLVRYYSPQSFIDFLLSRVCVNSNRSNN